MRATLKENASWLMKFLGVGYRHLRPSQQEKPTFATQRAQSPLPAIQEEGDIQGQEFGKVRLSPSVSCCGLPTDRYTSSSLAVFRYYGKVPIEYSLPKKIAPRLYEQMYTAFAEYAIPTLFPFAPPTPAINSNSIY